MRLIVWTGEARSEVRSAITRISETDPAAARLVLKRIHTAVALLAERPIGHQGRVKNTYEKLVLKTPYIIAYALSDRDITILHVIHGSRDWPEEAWPEDQA